MKETLESDRAVVSYLLGESSAEEQDEIERRYFSDRGFLEQVLAVENDLIDAYLRGGLTAHERARFESHFLASADRRDKLETAEALLKYLRESGDAEFAPAVTSWKQSLSRLLRPEGLALRIAFASLILAVIAVLWLFVDSRRRRAPLQQAHVEQQQAPESEPTAPLAQNTNSEEHTVSEKSADEPLKQKPALKSRRVPVPVIASFVLTPGLTRDGGGTNKLVIPHSAQFIQLQLTLEAGGSYKSYRAFLQRVGGGEIWRGRIQDNRAGRAATLRLPANLLRQGEYLLTVNGMTTAGESEIVGDYPFVVVRQR